MLLNLNDLHTIRTTFKEDNQFDFMDHALCLAATGSHSYNLATDTSDLDYVGICFPPMQHVLGIGNWEKWDPKKQRFGPSFKGLELDFKAFSLKRFVQLLCNANPTLLEMLWAPEEAFHYRHPDFLKIQERRELFNSKLVVKSMIGFAKNQLDRMTRVDGETGKLGDKRKQLVKEFGYDPKNAHHVIRLLKMGVEFLQTKEIKPWRTNDCEELISIKQGKWSIGKVQATANYYFKAAEVYDCGDCLPARPDMEKANEMVVEIVKDRVRRGY